MSELPSIRYQLISYYVLWLPPAAVSLALKFVMLHTTGIRAMGLALDRTPADKATRLFPSLFAFWETISVYREDYLLGVLIVPAVVFSLILLLPARVRLWTAAVISTLYTVFLIGQLNVYLDLGGFLSMGMFKESLRWVAGHPEDFEVYVALHLYRAAWMAGFAATLSVALTSQSLHRRWIKLPRTGQRIVFNGSALLLCGFGAATWVADLPSSRMHTSAQRYILQSLLPSLNQVSRFDQLGHEKLQVEYQELVVASDPSKESEYWAVARNYNVVYFVLETIPHRLLDLGADLDDLPNIRRLREASWIALDNYSTSALSNRALFSLFSSMYAPPVGPVVDAPNRRVECLLQRLRHAGYETVIYLPEYLPLQWEGWMLEAVGFGQRKVAEEIAADPPQAVERWRVRKWFDAYALRLLTDDIQRWAQQERRFVAAFAPQIGHAPWPDIREDGVERDLWERGREIVALEDQLLGELISTLEEVRVLDRTLIILTADHGVRHWGEDPEFPAGRPGEDAFHVPLMIYAPGVLTSPREIDWTTSHIDVSPTLATLLGINEGRGMEQGGQIWDPANRNRTIYFWAHVLEQVRGYGGPRHFALWNGLLDAVYVNARPQFDRSTQVPTTSPLHEDVVTSIRTLEDLQRAWLRQRVSINWASE